MEEEVHSVIESGQEHVQQNNGQEGNPHLNQDVQNIREQNVNHGNNNPVTYIEIITEKDESGQPLSVLEVDLIISREKGEEKRSLSINFAGIDTEKKELVEKSVNINQDSFHQLKEFFAQLEWNN